MATKTKRTEKSFSKFIEENGGGELGQQVRKEIEVVFPKHILRMHGKYSDYFASIEGAIDTQRLLREIFSLLIEERKSQGWSKSAILNFRYKGHNVQFVNGHLEKDEEDEMMPMREVIDRDTTDETMLRRLVSIDPADLDNISKLTNSYYLQTDIQVGWTDKMWSWISREKGTEEVAKILGLKIVSKTSEGQILNGGKVQTCLATRLCVHSEELKGGDIIDSAVDTYERMRKLRKDPSFFMGVEDVIEIHGNSEEVFLKVCSYGGNETIFSKFLKKLLEIAGAEDFDKAKVQTEQEVYVPDSPLKKIAGKTSACLARNQSKINIGLIAISLPLIVVCLLSNLSQLEAIAVMIPALCLLAISVWLNSEEGWIAKIGRRFCVLTLWIAVAIFYLLLLILGFEGFLTVIGFVVAVVVGIVTMAFVEMKTEERRKAFVYEELPKFMNQAGIWLERIILKILANSLVKVILMLFVIVLGIIAALSFSLLLIPLLVGYYILFVLLNKSFWEEVERDRERTIDRFFNDFRSKRPKLSSNCEVRFDVSKCRRLRNPLRGAFGKSVEFGRSKFPEWLTLPNVFKTCYRLGGKWRPKSKESTKEDSRGEQ